MIFQGRIQEAVKVEVEAAGVSSITATTIQEIIVSTGAMVPLEVQGQEILEHQTGVPATGEGLETIMKTVASGVAMLHGGNKKKKGEEHEYRNFFPFYSHYANAHRCLLNLFFTTTEVPDVGPYISPVFLFYFFSSYILFSVYFCFLGKEAWRLKNAFIVL